MIKLIDSLHKINKTFQKSKHYEDFLLLVG